MASFCIIDAIKPTPEDSKETYPTPPLEVVSPKQLENMIPRLSFGGCRNFYRMP